MRADKNDLGYSLTGCQSVKIPVIFLPRSQCSQTGESDLGGLVAHNSQSSLDKCTLTQRTLSDVWLLELNQQVHSHCGN